MLNKKEALNSSGNESIVKAKDVRCWYCHLHGYNILNEFNCCKRCGTNLKKYPHRGDHERPDLSDERIAREVLGSRKKFTIKNEGGQENW